MPTVRHIVLCGWNDNGHRLLADLLLSDLHPTVQVISPSASRPAHTRVQRVEFVSADPSTAAGLREVDIERADVVVILADNLQNPNQQDADARTILTGLAVRHRHPGVHTIAELFNPDNIFHAKNAGVNEVLISDAHTGAMLSQAALSPGVLTVFHDLLQSGQGSRIRELALPDALVGVTVLQAYAAVLTDQKGVLLGFRRGDRIKTVPTPDTVLQAEDRLIVLQRVATP